MSAPCRAPILLARATANPLLAALRVVTDAPAPAEDPVVALYKLGEGIPRGRVERSDRAGHRRVLSSVCAPIFQPGGLTGGRHGERSAGWLPRHVSPRQPLQPGGGRDRSAC